VSTSANRRELPVLPALAALTSVCASAENRGPAGDPESRDAL
jgi:hypothetical protein